MNWLIKKINKKRRIIFLIILICLLISILSSYNLFDNDASYKDGKKSNTPYAVQQHVSNVDIGSNGKIESGMSAQELWDQMKKDGSRVNKYLKNPKELQKLINAQRITDYLDTRENPDEDIDWDAINEDVDSKEVQGIVKLKRAQTDGSIATLTYVDPETFQSYIDNYNNSGSESDKQNALKHFTLEKGYKSSSSFGTGEAITAGTTITIPSGLGAYHTYMGWQMITSTSSTQYKLREQAGMNFDNEGFGRINGRYVIACTTTFGNVGDYIDFYQDDGSVLQCIIGDIKNQNDAGCNEWGHENGQVIIEFVVDKGSWYNCNHPNPGSQGFHTEWNKPLTKAINGGSYFDNPSFGSSNITANGNTTGGSSTIGNDVMKWPTDGTDITSYFGLRDAPTAGASTNHGAIDIGVPTGTNVYATEAGTVIKAEFNSSGGNWVWIDHGNGYVTKYLHNSQLKVSVGDKVTKGQVIALSGTTGTSTGPHVHFQIEYNGEKVDPLSFKYDNDMGNGSGGFGSDSSSLSTTNTFYAKVATWSEIKKTVTSNDPTVEGKNETVYNMTSTKIDYEQFVSGYRMPFDYLWALLVITQDKDFIFDVADLVYNSEINITVHDNLSVNTNITTDTYERQTKTITDNVRVIAEYTDTIERYDSGDTKHENPHEGITTGRIVENGGPYEKETEVPYKTTTTVITTTNTLDVQLTRANVWIVDYSQEFKQQKQDPVVSGSQTGPDTENYPEEPTRTDGNDSAGLAEGFRQEVQAKYAASHTTATATIESLTSKYYERIKDRIVKIDNTLETTKYISEPAVIKEKTDKKSKEPNFVTLLIKHKTAKGRIISGRNILFNILKKGPNTKDVLLDLTKYLLYKTTGKDYGMTEFDFSIFDPANFKSPSDQYGGSSNIEGVPGQIFDFLLSKGMPAPGAAAVVGNIERESTFDPKSTNGTHTGLCQWSNSDRFVKLKAYASSKGKDWSDVDIQLEFLWSELEESYKDVKNVMMSSSSEADMEYATWYWGRHFEVYFLGNYESTKNMTEPKTRYGCAQKWYKEWQEKHTGGSANVQAGEAAKIQGTEARIQWLYDGKGVPKSEAENNKYLETFQVEYLDQNGAHQTMNITMHKKLKTEVQAIFRDMVSAGFRIVGGDVSYRQWGTDDGFNGQFKQSAHTYGHAFDVNPEQNYCIYGDGSIVGKFYKPGENPYSVTPEIINIWKQHGFYWGGDWNSPKDYMHFSYFDH